MKDGPRRLELQGELCGGTLAAAAARVQSLYPTQGLPRIEGWWFTHPEVDDDGPVQAGSPTDDSAVLPADAIGIVFSLADREREHSQLVVVPRLDPDDAWDWELSLSFGTDHLSEAEITRRLAALVEFSQRLAESGALLGGSLHRSEGALMLPEPPVLKGASHILVCRACEVDEAYVDPADFWGMWDDPVPVGELTLCTRALESIANPDFLIAVYDAQMRAVHARRHQRNHYALPAGSHPEEWNWLAGRPSALAEVYYDPGDRRVEYELAKDVQLSAMDIRRLVSAKAERTLPDGRRVDKISARAVDLEHAERAARVLGEIGVEVWLRDDHGDWICFDPAEA
jgi:hypothetical protein